MIGGRFRSAVGVVGFGTNAQVGAGLDDSLPDVTAPCNGNVQQTAAYGTGPSMFSILVAQTRALGPGASETFDLYAGTDLRDLFGEAAAMRNVKSVVAYVVSGGGDEGVAYGGAASQAWYGFLSDPTDAPKFFPGGPALCLGSPDGAAVGATTNKLKVANLSPSEPVVYRLMICATVAVTGVPMGMLLTLTYP